MACARNQNVFIESSRLLVVAGRGSKMAEDQMASSKVLIMRCHLMRFFAATTVEIRS